MIMILSVTVIYVLHTNKIRYMETFIGVNGVSKSMGILWIIKIN